MHNEVPQICCQFRSRNSSAAVPHEGRGSNRVRGVVIVHLLEMIFFPSHVRHSISAWPGDLVSHRGLIAVVRFTFGSEGRTIGTTHQHAHTQRDICLYGTAWFWLYFVSFRTTVCWWLGEVKGTANAIHADTVKHITSFLLLLAKKRMISRSPGFLRRTAFSNSNP